MMGLTSKIISIERKIPWSLKPPTARALTRLHGNGIRPNISGFSLDDIGGPFGLYIKVREFNKKRLPPPVSFLRTARTVRAIGKPKMIKEFRFFEIKKVCVAESKEGQYQPYNLIQKWAESLYLEVRAIFGKTALSQEALLGKFFSIANQAQTAEEKEIAIKTLIAMVKIHDHSTWVHQNEVEKWSVAIARKMRLSEEKIKVIELAAKLHDIGKIGIAKEILDKRNGLSVEELDVLHEHVVMGVFLLEVFDWLHPIIPMIYHHHYYKFYPEEVSPRKAPLGARIIAVADSYDAMTGGRIYEGKKTKEEAIAELRTGGFDPEVVEAFIRVLGGSK